VHEYICWSSSSSARIELACRSVLKLRQFNVLYTKLFHFIWCRYRFTIILFGSRMLITMTFLEMKQKSFKGRRRKRKSYTSLIKGAAGRRLSTSHSISSQAFLGLEVLMAESTSVFYLQPFYPDGLYNFVCVHPFHFVLTAFSDSS
jgi:hypothetical protein